MAVNDPLCHANHDMLLRLLPFHGVKEVLNGRGQSYADGILTVDQNGTEQKLACDSVILSVRYQEENQLYKELQFEIPEIYLIGDAKNVSNIMYGIWDAFEVANYI